MIRLVLLWEDHEIHKTIDQRFGMGRNNLFTREYHWHPPIYLAPSVRLFSWHLRARVDRVDFPWLFSVRWVCESVWLRESFDK